MSHEIKKLVGLGYFVKIITVVHGLLPLVFHNCIELKPHACSHTKADLLFITTMVFIDHLIMVF